MNLETQLKLQSLLDGEATVSQRRELEALLEGDAEARALLAELRTTRNVIAENEPLVPVPESREFYWSKIEREIQRLAKTPEGSTSGGLLRWLRRVILPAAGFAVVVLALMVTTPRQPGALEVEAGAGNGGALTYRDHANGVTLVWLSFPAADEETDYEAPPLALAK